MTSWKARLGLGLFACILLAAAAGAGTEAQQYEAMTKAYMDSYKAYLQAKINNDPATPQRLKEFNDAFNSYIAILNKGRKNENAEPMEPRETHIASSIAGPLPPDSLPLSTSEKPNSSGTTDGSGTADPAGSPISGTASAPASIPETKPASRTMDSTATSTVSPIGIP